MGLEETMSTPEEARVRDSIMVDEWHGAYAQGWPRELLVPDAFAHP